MTAVLLALGAGAGAAVRFTVAHLLDGRWPTGTLLVNVSGSFLLGLMTPLALSGAAVAMLGAGFCGALTTYSAFVVQAHERGRRLGGGYAAATLMLSMAACALGFWAGASAGH